MGVCQSNELKNQVKANQQITADLKAAESTLRAVIKLLLLGTAESGKSTILKQMQIIHKQGFGHDHGENRKDLVYENTINSMAAMLKAMNALDIGMEDPENQIYSRLILNTSEQTEDFEDAMTTEVYEALKHLWADKGVRQVMDKSNEFQLIDSAKHFLDSLDRIAQPNYIPNEQDILRIRYPTLGVNQVVFQSNRIEFRVFDVGGQRSERRKWIHCFDDVSGMIYVLALSEFDLKLIEDGTTNRMIESLSLFNWVCNHESFVDTMMIIFFNKKDIFAEKLKRGAKITESFPEYKGPASYEPCLDHIRERFKALNQDPAKTIYMHETCATDTDQVSIVISGVLDSLIDRNMKTAGMT